MIRIERIIICDLLRLNIINKIDTLAGALSHYLTQFLDSLFAGFSKNSKIKNMGYYTCRLLKLEELALRLQIQRFCLGFVLVVVCFLKLLKNRD
jgi:hypothetical protein